MTLEKIASMLAEYKDMDVAGIGENTEFSALGIDSLDIVDIVMQLEDAFGVSIELDQGIKTVGELAKLIDESK